jgi:DNA topoisomerase-6 subunit B
MLLNMLQDSTGKTVKEVLMADFSRITQSVAEHVCQLAKVNPKADATSIMGDDVERLHKALGEVKVMAPPASCIVPIGEELLIAGLQRRFKNAFYVSTTRPPSVYRGNPFVVEVGLAYGGDLPADEPAEIMRFANRVPLQYQPKACAISEAIYDTNWRNYELSQPKGSLPIGPLAIVVHLASVWVPFTSEAKEAVAHYDDLLREMRFAVQECGRKLGSHLRAREKALSEQKRLSIFQRYIPEVAAAMSTILAHPKDKIETAFTSALPNFVKVEEVAAAEEAAQKPSLPPGHEVDAVDLSTIPPPPTSARKSAKGAPTKKAPAKKSPATKSPATKSGTKKNRQLDLL